MTPFDAPRGHATLPAHYSLRVRLPLLIDLINKLLNGQQGRVDDA